MQAAQLVPGKKYAVRQTQARDYSAVRRVPIVSAEFVGPVRAGKAKMRWLEGERADLEEWLSTRHLLCRWGDRKRFLRDEERLHALKRAASDLDPVIEEAISAVFEASGESGGFSKLWDGPPEQVRRLWSRSGLDGDPLRQHGAFVDRSGVAHLSSDTAHRWAQAFAAAEADVVGLYLARVEEEYVADGWTFGQRFQHDAFRQSRPAHAVVRDWSTQADRHELTKEVDRLQKLLYRAIALLEESGQKSAARRIRTAWKTEGSQAMHGTPK